MAANVARQRIMYFFINTKISKFAYDTMVNNQVPLRGLCWLQKFTEVLQRASVN